MTLSITINKTQHSAHFLIKSADCLACLSMGSRLLFFYSFAQIRERAFPVFHATVSIFLPKNIFVNAAHKDSKIIHTTIFMIYHHFMIEIELGCAWAWQLGQLGEISCRFCHQVAAWVPDTSSDLYFMKNTKLLITQQHLKLEKM